jgi:antitoxin MazE
VIRPIEKAEYDLDALVGCITAGNAHGEISFGGPVGKEAL